MIEKWLSEIEQEYRIDILFASETGSRAWGGATEHSDYDVRFIFKHREIRSYLSLQKTQETIDFQVPFDAQGWDIFKAFSLLQKSNPSMLEWSFSPIVYNEDNLFSEKLRNLVFESYSLFSLYQHYIHLMAKNLKDIRDKEFLSASQKKLIQAIRAFLLAKTIVQTKEIPSGSLYSSFDNLIPDRFVTFYVELLKAKQAGIVVPMNAVKEVINAIENEKKIFDVLSDELPRGKNIRPQLNQWVWELLGV